MIYKTEAGGQEILRRYGEALKSWPVPAEHRRVSTREGETFVVVSGPAGAPPLVLFHGSGTNTVMWLADVAEWAKHLRVYAVDMIGEPGFSARSRPALDSEAYALWLDDVLDALGLTRVAIAGMSLGGWLALDYATRRPERVTRLALLCPGGIGRQTYGWVFKTLLYKPFGKWGLRKSMKAVAGVDANETPEIADYLGLIFTHFLPRREKLPVFDDDTLKRLTMPVLAIVGGRDAMFDSHETAGRLEATVPRASVTMLPDVAHSITGQTGPVLDFLRG
ncbi:alpha/beta hydrolase [Amycolatopsis sp. K13G38]|uniref:Alpha/beta hydrolase n=1 Tax=Amycolatopsis acididurans TaxID=2724524 RepID=A0ABX1JGA3_9PSEU|nr:alpha/beta hydrolase [Amycolatopsis acididurans]NKQ57277.1 alpha/beta hydrolase [Amycolatopsis acididurans]